MTWGGAQGFQTPIESENFIVKDMGVFGNMHTERKLTCKLNPFPTRRQLNMMNIPDVEFYFSGHMTPRKLLKNKLDSALDWIIVHVLQNSCHGRRLLPCLICWGIKIRPLLRKLCSLVQEKMDYIYEHVHV